MNNVSIKKQNEYFQLLKKPTEGELKNYYRNIYYQETRGAYQKKYSGSEIKYINNSLELISLCIKNILNTDLRMKKYLDLGSGEGWALKHFQSLGCNVTGIDYSDYALKKFNKAVSKYYLNENMTEFIHTCIKEKNKYDIINLTNVIEHVLFPERLLRLIKKILMPHGLAIVTFPNDFSTLQKYLLKKKKINEPFWIVSPDHISYFNKNSFTAMSIRLGFKPVCFIADFPIDLFLLNENSNYIIDRTKGKPAHLSCVDFINMICNINKHEALDLMLKFGKLGIGRNLSAFLKI